MQGRIGQHNIYIHRYANWPSKEEAVYSIFEMTLERIKGVHNKATKKLPQKDPTKWTKTTQQRMSNGSVTLPKSRKHKMQEPYRNEGN